MVVAGSRRAQVVSLVISATATTVRLRQIGWGAVVIEKGPGRAVVPDEATGHRGGMMSTGQQ
jgi:hypothetical protein